MRYNRSMAYAARPARPRSPRSDDDDDDDEYYEAARPQPLTVHDGDARFTGIYDAHGAPIWCVADPIGFRFTENEPDDGVGD